jgi:Uncharacterised nucleotidyltransferase
MILGEDVRRMSSTADHELLLRAALLDREPALAAWDAWKVAKDLAAVDKASRRLLPLLYRNLERHAVDDPRMKSLATIHAEARRKNERLLDRVGAMLRAFEAAGIRTLVLKGIALATLHYRDIGARPMADVDILVPVGQARDAMALLRARGWRHAQAGHPETHIPYCHSANFRDPSRLQLDLHWHVMIQCCQAEADAAFWAAAREVEIAQAPTRVLSPADQLLHVCVHGMAWRHRPRLIRWIADALTIISAEGQQLDWSRLAEQAEARRLGHTIRCAMDYLVERFDASIPSTALARLRSIRTTVLERLEHRTCSRGTSDDLLGVLVPRWFAFRRLPIVSRRGGRAVAFVDFLRHSWKLERRREVPAIVLKKALRRGVRRPADRLARWLAAGSRPRGS